MLIVGEGGFSHPFPMSEHLKENVVEWKEVSSKLIWVQMKWSGEIRVWVSLSAYGP